MQSLKEFDNEPGKPDLTKAMIDYLQAEKDKRFAWDNTVIHASDLATLREGCVKSLWLRLNGYIAQENTPGKDWMFEQGHRIHELLGDILREHLEEDWWVESIEGKTAYKNITGRFDCKISNGEKTVIIDFKTVRSNSFNFLDSAKKAHEIQLQFYLKAENADYGIVLYVDREGQNFAKQFRIERNDELVDELIDEASVLINQEHPPDMLNPVVTRVKNKGPDSVKVNIPWQCQYCDYLDTHCKSKLSPEYRDNKVKGKIDKGVLKMKTDYADLGPIVMEHLEVI